MINQAYVPPRPQPKRFGGIGLVQWFWAACLVVWIVGMSIMLWAVFGR